jgi:signal transduction histidine kinase
LRADNGVVSQARELVARSTRWIGGTRDVMFVVTVVLVVLAIVEAGNRGRTTGADVGTAILLGLWATVPVAFLPAHPVAATLAVTTANVVLIGGTERPFVAGVLAQLIALLWLGRTQPRRVALAFLLPFVVLALGRPSPGETVLLVLFAAAVLLGGAVRDRGDAAASEQASRATADTLLEHAARGERARIARELHDVVAHAMSVIVVQAGAERMVLGEGQESTRSVLAGIEATGRQALGEMRRLLGMMRAGDEELALAPQPSVTHLPELCDQVRAAGLPVELVVEGEPVELPPGVDVSAYRIVQEALTNALKHAGPASARVAVRYMPDELAVEVVDDGRGAEAAPNGGHGLIGMRERVTVYGGRLETGNRDAGGYAVRVRLPLGGTAQ